MRVTPRLAAAHLAAILAQQRWTASDLGRHLTQHLPQALHSHVPSLVRDLRAEFSGPVAPGPTTPRLYLVAHPAIARLAKHCTKYSLPLPPSLTPPRCHPAPAFANLGLPDLPTLEALASHLALAPLQLTRFADLISLSNHTDNPFAPHYRFHPHPKPKGGHRLIEAPKPLLKTLQRRLLRSLLDHVPPHPAVHGFTKSRSPSTAAAKHAAEEMVIRFDLANFFPSITARRIHGLFRTMGYPHAVARHLTGLSTVATPPHILRLLDPHLAQTASIRHLPQGAPTSPALANLCSFGLDRRLAGLARRFGATYTRYADDLTFSGDAIIARPLLNMVPIIVVDAGFRLNPTKTKVMPAHQRQSTTGIVINRHINIRRADYDRLKATLHRFKSAPITPESRARLSGQIRWVEQINPHRGAKLRTAFDALPVNG